MAGRCDCTRVMQFTFAFIIFCCSVGLVSSRACKSSDFGNLLLACNVNKTRSIVPFMKTKCDPTVTGSYFPKPIENLPCDCPPGQGIQIQTRPSFSWKCAICKAGNYSLGGLLIDTWERWNGSLNVPGSGYKFTPFCSSVVSQKACHGWQPSPDFTHLVSSPFLNITKNTYCYDHKSMQTYMTFSNSGEGNNYISFRYKVDGTPCSMRTTIRKACKKGLMFYVDEVLVMRSESQFTWRIFKYNLTAGTHVFKWTYISTCNAKDGSLDVAYITHVAFIGVGRASTMCNPCPPGTYSNKDGSTECTKCDYGKYQDKSGQTSCLECPAGQFSHKADKGCFPLRKCQPSDYRTIPDPISKCYLENGKVIRKQKSTVPNWPGMSTAPCIADNQPESTTSCECQPGWQRVPIHVINSRDTYECHQCRKGFVSNTNTSSCVKCPHGYAAVPGIFYKEWVGDTLPEIFTLECSGSHCADGKGWVPAGKSIVTNRMPGNFETKVMLKDLQLNYYKSYVKFNCSVDCRINPSTNEMAKAADCFLRFSITRDQATFVRDVDCIKYGRDHLRNGTVMNHFYMLTRPGNYTLKWLFHQNDDESTNVLSYQAKIHSIQVLGVPTGSAPKCIKCLAGSEVSKDGSTCLKCPLGHYSSDGKKCKVCPPNSFQDKIGRSKCIPCGANTKVNATRTGCLINDCKFEAAPGVLYDLMPMARVGGPMSRVKENPRKGRHPWYRNYFYVNLCTLEHDNTSCTDLQTRRKDNGLYVRESVILKTMACKRWSLSSRYSYSLGRVMGFKKLANVSAGLTVELTDGYNCYNKFTQQIQPAKTKITMICNLYAGYGVPMPAKNATTVEVKPCEFHLYWETVYACPICKNFQLQETHTDCVDGKKNITYQPPITCRNATANQQRYTKYFVACKAEKYSSGTGTAHYTGLIIIILIFVLIAIGLIVTVILLLRKNRLYRTQLFSPGTHMTQLKEDDDLHELIDE